MMTFNLAEYFVMGVGVGLFVSGVYSLVRAFHKFGRPGYQDHDTS